MQAILESIRRRLILKITIPIAAILFASIFVWSAYHIGFQQRFATDYVVMGADRVCNTVKMGLYYAMLMNSRGDIKAIVHNISRLKEIRSVRIINKSGQVMFANVEAETNRLVSQREAMCQVCHDQEEPRLNPPLTDRIYSDTPQAGERLLHVVSPIFNEQSCSTTSSCHFHKPHEKLLGVLDIALSMDDTDALVSESRWDTINLAVILFAGIFAALVVLVFVLIKRPIGRIIDDAKILSKGQQPPRTPRESQRYDDEIGQLAAAIRQMGGELIAKNNQLNLQKNLYQDLFEGVPCLVTVQDRDFRLMSFNRTFGDRFSAKVGDHCYKAYKNKDAKCADCPVEKTFKTGKPQTTEESGCYWDGSKAHWIVTTSPIHDAEGNIVAAMEMCLDITERKELEGEVKRSEKKYIDIFNNIPSAVFLLDQADFAVLDCNRSATSLYGYGKDELIGMSFLSLFVEQQRDGFMDALRRGKVIDQTRHVTKDGRKFYVSINSSPSEFSNRKVFLVTAMDITKRLEAEQQLIQASKMATLGEMATGVAHEINQPLAVIQASMDLVKRNLHRGEAPEMSLLTRISELVGAQVERATKIISHMREFGRKSDIQPEKIDLNDVLRKSFEFFSQQLALRSIEVAWELDERLPMVRCEPNRMEQVFINFLINARDAIEERGAREGRDALRRIGIKTMHNQEFVTVRISDTGVGVPEDLKARIFEPFFTTKQVGKGTGLGLSISYGIVKEYGGAINVTNNETGGASFFIRLPVAKD